MILGLLCLSVPFLDIFEVIDVPLWVNVLAAILGIFLISARHLD